MGLHTKDGVPLQVSGDAVFNPQGENFGHLRGDKVYGLDGQYRGTVVSGRLVHRNTDSATVGSPRAAIAGVGSASAHAAGAALVGDEPDISA